MQGDDPIMRSQGHPCQSLQWVSVFENGDAYTELIDGLEWVLRNLHAQLWCVVTTHNMKWKIYTDEIECDLTLKLMLTNFLDCLVELSNEQQVNVALKIYVGIT